MKALFITPALLLGIAGPVAAADFTLHSFKKIVATDQFWAEGACVGDFNKDGQGDVASGPFWYAGPDFKQRHEYYPANATFKRKKPDGSEAVLPGYEGAQGVNNAYADNFFTFSRDLNGDGWDDLLVIGMPGEAARWYENPKGRAGHWQKHIAIDSADNESPWLTDFTGGGKAEIVCSTGGFWGWAEPSGGDATKPWTFHRLSPKGPWQRYTHGLGVGDVNGDGRLDLLEKDGWWEQPASLAGDPVWTFHKYLFSPGGGAQMFAYDVNGDGRNDVIASVAAHGYGLAWYEQVIENGQATFREHIFVNKEPHENKYGVKFSQLHAVEVVDMDGDGLKDIVTGKRFWAHGPQGDAEPNAPAVLYWFKLVRGPGGTVDYLPHLVDTDSGVGTQVTVADVNGDRLLDIVVGNKKGLFIFLHEARKVSESEWLAAQPKPLQ